METHTIGQFDDQSHHNILPGVFKPDLYQAVLHQVPANLKKNAPGYTRLRRRRKVNSRARAPKTNCDESANDG